MLNQKQIKPSMFQMVTLEQLVPKEYIYRRIDKVLDLSFVRETVKDLYCADNGRPAIEPERIMRMMLIGYLEDLSDERLCLEIGMHAGYRWFCRLDFHDPVPDRTTLIKTRARWGVDSFDRLFREVLDQCVQAGLVKGDVVAIDGTQVRARAAIQSLEPIEPVASIEEYLAHFDESKDEDEKPPKPPTNDGNKDFRGEKFSNETHRSKTDPDARLYRKAKGQEAHLRYLVHNALDVKSGVILDTEATRATGYAERETALEFLKRFTNDPYLLMDKNYRSADFLAEVLASGGKPLVPMEDIDPVPVPVWRRRTFKLSRQLARLKEVNHARAVNFAKSLNGKPIFVKNYAKRVKIEHKFAEAKEHHGLRRARGYGLDAMRIQARMTAMVQNIKRLVSFRRKSRPHVKQEVTQANRSGSVFKVRLQIFMTIYRFNRRWLLCH
jgi:IS5 family transposase